MTSSSLNAASRRVLIVDNHRDTVEITALFLRHFGYAVETATDGYQAIETACRQRPSHVLLNLAMPGMDGYQVAARLRRELPGPLILIAITGHGREEDRRRSREAGIDYHVLKPADLDELLSLLSAEGSGIGVRQATPGAEPNPTAEEPHGASTAPSNGHGTTSGGGEIAPETEPPPQATRQEGTSRLRASRRSEISNALGLHLRAATKLVQLAQQYQSDVWVACDGRKVNGRSLLDVMTLAAECGMSIELEAEGREAEAALDALVGLIDRGFDETNG